MQALPVIHFLEQDGHRVTHALDGAEALEKYHAELPDLVLMDIEMPNMDGIEATRRIREISVKKWIPIVILTGLKSDKDLICGLEAGADDYMTKPVNFEVLLARMKSKQRIVDMQNNLFGILENVHEGILTINQQGIVQSFNLAAEKIFGYEASEVTGRNVNMLMPEQYRTQHDGYLKNILAASLPRVIGMSRKVQGLRKNGEVFPMYLAVTQVKSATGDQYIGLLRDISQEEANLHRIEHLARHDTMTGLLNRSCFTEQLDNYVRNALPFSLLFIDIDGFKTVNDTYGHGVGDQLLIAIAQRIRSCVAENDIVARLGGDEFVVILPDVVNSTDIERIAVRLIGKVAEKMTYKGCVCSVGASIGAACYPAQSMLAEDILSAADSAMYHAKRTGKNRFVMAGTTSY